MCWMCEKSFFASSADVLSYLLYTVVAFDSVVGRWLMSFLVELRRLFYEMFTGWGYYYFMNFFYTLSLLFKKKNVYRLRL